MKRTFVFVAVAIACASLFHCSADVASSEEQLQIGNTFDRIAQARMYISGVGDPTNVHRTLPYEEGQQQGYVALVAGDLKSVSPTYVSGLIRYNGPRPWVNGKEAHALQQEEIDAFQKVRQALPGTKLDVVLSPIIGGKDDAEKNGDCPSGASPTQPCRLTPGQMERLMTDVEEAIHPDIWFFDFFTDGHAATAAKAIEFAHATVDGNGKPKQKQLIGGHYFGNQDNGTKGANFFAVVDDACGHLGKSTDAHSAQSHIDFVKSKGVPVLVHVNNNAQNGGTVQCDDGTTKPETFACTWNDWPQSQRKSYIQERHQQAHDRGFTFMYPVFFPACASDTDPLKVYYDSAHDGLLAYIGSKM